MVCVGSHSSKDHLVKDQLDVIGGIYDRDPVCVFYFGSFLVSVSYAMCLTAGYLWMIFVHSLVLGISFATLFLVRFSQ